MPRRGQSYSDVMRALIEVHEGQQLIASKMDNITQNNVALANRMDRFAGAFPGEDYEGHRRAHQQAIEDTRTRKELAAAIKEKTISGLVWSAIVGLGISCWAMFKGTLITAIATNKP